MCLKGDPGPLAFPCQNNELTRSNRTRQYLSVCECEDWKGKVLLSWLRLKKEPKTHDISTPGRLVCNPQEEI